MFCGTHVWQFEWTLKWIQSGLCVWKHIEVWEMQDLSIISCASKCSFATCLQMVEVSI